MNTNKLNTGGEQIADLTARWQANKERFEALCEEQQQIYNPEFEAIFNTLFEIDPDQREVFNNLFADLPEEVDPDTLNQALQEVGASEEVARGFKRYTDVTLEGKRLQQENFVLNMEIEQAKRPKPEARPEGWRFMDFSFIVPQPLHPVIGDMIQEQAQKGEGLFSNNTEVAEQPDEALDEFLGVEVYNLKCSYTHYLHTLKEYQVTDVTLGRDFTHFLFQYLKLLADNIKGHTDRPEAVKTFILECVTNLDELPIWGLIFQILTLQGLTDLLACCLLKEGEYGFLEKQELAEWLKGILEQKLIKFIYTPYGDGDKQRLQPLCDYLYHTPIGRAIQDHIFGTPDQQADPDTSTPEAVDLPSELNTERARKYFARAVEREWMATTSTGYKWMFGGARGCLARLGYFVMRVFCPTNTEQIPEQAINRLFGVNRIGGAITQLHQAKKPQKWRAEIDSLFDD